MKHRVTGEITFEIKIIRSLENLIVAVECLGNWSFDLMTLFENKMKPIEFWRKRNWIVAIKLLKPTDEKIKQ